MKVILRNWIGFVVDAAALAGALAGSASAQASKTAPVKQEEALRAADRLLASGKYAEARAAYDRVAPAGSPVEDLVRYKRAFAAAKTGDLATSGADYAAVAEGTKGRLAGSALLHRAEVAHRCGDESAAEAAYGRLAEAHADHPQAGVALSHILTNIAKAKAAGRPVPPGLLHAAEVLASHGAGTKGRRHGREGEAGPGRRGSPGPPPGKGAGASRGNAERGTGEGKGPPPSKSPPRDKGSGAPPGGPAAGSDKSGTNRGKGPPHGLPPAKGPGAGGGKGKPGSDKDKGPPPAKGPPRDKVHLNPASGPGAGGASSRPSQRNGRPDGQAP
ncbi:MAG TPA: hypothetical protein VFI25_12715 [Planctomycetota bacterium]|jgi:hypothetical protein|nr:hypothetical protein [Planctomycetota bacterium]